MGTGSCQKPCVQIQWNSILTWRSYVKDIVSTFKDDERVLMWDLYNEPGEGSIALLQNVYKWVREINPSQPLTSGINNLDHIEINNFRLENSDVITYHNYADTEEET